MSVLNLREFPLRVGRISARSGQFPIRVAGPVPGGMLPDTARIRQVYTPEIFETPEGSLLQALAARRITGAQLYRLGGILCDLLLPERVRRLFLDSLEWVHQQNKTLRLRLIIEDPRLAVLPWEYLYLKPSGETHDDPLFFLALRQDLSIVRHEATRQAEPVAPAQSSYRLVAAFASPQDQRSLNLDSERLALEAMLNQAQASPEIGKITPAWETGATRSRLRRALEQPAELFHFAGHGKYDGRRGTLLLERPPDQNSDFYPADRLANLLRAARTRLAVLNACETAQSSGENPWSGVANALMRAGVAAVVASQYTLNDANALDLSVEIYRSVLSGESVDRAVYRARQALFQNAGLENRDWGALVLYLRTADGVLFPTPEGAPGAGRAAPRSIPHDAPTRPAEKLVGYLPEELQAERQRLLQGGKLYLHGPYGVGKTSLAAELFHQALETQAFPDGSLWRSADRLEPEAALEWVAARLQVDSVRMESGPAAKADALRQALSERRLIIGLDEVSNAEVARLLLRAAGGSTVLLNGAQNIELGGLGQEKALQPLSREAARQLFIEIALRSQPPPNAQQVQVIDEIVDDLEYLPLSVRLAARYYQPGMDLAAFRQRLRLRPEAPFTQDPGLNSVLSELHSQVQTDPAARLVLVRLASYPTFEASEAWLSEEMDLYDFLDATDRLFRMGVIEARPNGRWGLHRILGIGLGRFEEAAVRAEQTRTEQRLREYAERQRDNLEIFSLELENLLALIDRMQASRRWDDLIGLLKPCFHFLRIRGLWHENLARLDAVLQNPQLLQVPHNLGWTYLHRGIMRTLRNHLDEAEADLEAALRIFEGLQDRPYQGKTLYRLGSLAILRGQLQQAEADLRQALELMGEQGYVYDRAGAHERLASLLAVHGKLKEAHDHYQEAIRLGDAEIQARTYMALGELYRAAERFELAEDYFQRALRLADHLGHTLQKAGLLQQIGYLHFYQERLDEAEQSFQAAGELYSQLHYPAGMAQAQHSRGNIALRRGRLDEAEAAYQEALRINQVNQLARNSAFNRYQLAVIAHRKGDRNQAIQLYTQVNEQAQEMEDLALQAAALAQMGILAYEGRDFSSARLLFEQAAQRAQQMQDRRTEGISLYYQGLLQAQAGDLEQASKTLAQAHADFTALKSVDFQKVEDYLRSLPPETQPQAAGIQAPILDGILPPGLPLDTYLARVLKEMALRTGPGKTLDLLIGGGVIKTIDAGALNVLDGGDFTGIKLDNIG